MRGSDLKNFRVSRGIKQAVFADLFGKTLEEYKKIEEECGHVFPALVLIPQPPINKAFTASSLYFSDDPLLENKKYCAPLTPESVIRKFIAHTNELIDKGSINDPNTLKWINENMKLIVDLYNGGRR